MLGTEYGNLSAPEVNAKFIAKTASPEGLAEINTMGTQYIRNTLKEYSIWRQVIPPVYKRPAELFPALDNDTLWDLIWLEPETTGRVVTFQGDGDHETITGKRAAIYFGALMSPLFDKTITELSVYRIPITKIIEENAIKYLHTLADLKITLAALASCKTTGNWLSKQDLAASGAGAITAKSDIAMLSKKLDGADRAARFLMFNQSVKDDLFAIPYTEVGDKETWLNGFKYQEIAGLTAITSVKSKVFKPQLVFCATAPEFLGVYEILEEPNFYVKRENHRIQMQAREVEAFAIVNEKSIAVLDTGNDDSAITGFTDEKVWFNNCAPSVSGSSYGTDPMSNTLLVNV